MIKLNSTILTLAVLLFTCLSVNADNIFPPQPNQQQLTTSFKPVTVDLPPTAKVIPDEYIVTFHHSTSHDAINELVQQLQSVQYKKSKPVKHFKLIKTLSTQLSKTQLQQLRHHKAVKAIEANTIIELAPVDIPTTPNQTSRLYNNNFSSATGAVDSWGLDRIDNRQLPLDGIYAPPSQGQGVHAYIFDSGLEINHSHFNGRASWFYTASDITDGDIDGNGHGTHMAGIVGGSTHGVAAQVNLHAVKVLNNQGIGTMAGLIEAIEYLITHHQTPAVATIGFNTPHSVALNTATDNAIAAGISFAVPSGDASKDGCNYSPGSSSHAITVASTWDDDRASVYSNHGSCIDIYAPGLYIKSDWHTTLWANNTISHSPLSAAFVAGAAALIRAENPGFNPAQIKSTLLAQSSENELTLVPSNTPNLLLNINPTTHEPQTYPGEQTGAYGNIAMIGTNGLTAGSYSASATYVADQPAGAFDGHFYHGIFNADAGAKVARGMWGSYTPVNWLQIDFGKQAYITGFGNYVSTAILGYTPTSAVLQVSDNGVDFVDHESFAINGQANTITLTTPAQGRYFRMLFTLNSGVNMAIGELEYYGAFIQ